MDSWHPRQVCGGEGGAEYEVFAELDKTISEPSLLSP